MGQVLKILFIGAAIISVAGLLSAFIPTTFTNSINSAFIYFLSSLSILNFLFDMNIFYICMQIIGNFLFAVLYFFIIRWALHLFAK